MLGCTVHMYYIVCRLFGRSGVGAYVQWENALCGAIGFTKFWSIIHFVVLTNQLCIVMLYNSHEFVCKNCGIVSILVYYLLVTVPTY